MLFDGQTGRQIVSQSVSPSVLPGLFARRRLRSGEEGSERVNPSIILTSDPSGSMFLPPVERESKDETEHTNHPEDLQPAISTDDYSLLLTYGQKYWDNP